MTEYYNKPTRIGGSTSDRLSPGRRKIRLRLAQKNGSEGMVLDLKDIFLLPSSPSNLVSLALLNNGRIYHNNENETLYNVDTKEVLA